MAEVGKLNNKFLRGGFAALLSAYAAKKDPYLLKGFVDKIDEFETADRELRDKLAAESAKTIAETAAKNELRRQEKKTKAEPSLKLAIANEIDPYVAGVLMEKGQLKSAIALKQLDNTLDINKLVRINEPYLDKAKGFTLSNVLEKTGGEILKVKNAIKQIDSPEIRGPLSRFITGDRKDPDFVSSVEKRVASQISEDVSSDYVPIDYSQATLSEQGQKLFGAMSAKDPFTPRQVNVNIADWVTTTMRINKASLDREGNPVFDRDTKENNIIAKKLTDNMTSEALNLTKDANSPAFNNSDVAMQIVKRKYEKADEDKLSVLNIPKINESFGYTLPETWTPARSTGKEGGDGNKNNNKNGDKGEVKKTKQERINDLIKKYEKKKEDLLKEFNGDTNNSLYQNKLRIAGNKIRENIKDLGGTGSEIPYKTKNKKDD